jgi:hypothetical protein
VGQFEIQQWTRPLMPAMKARVSKRIWSREEIVTLID